MAAALCDRAGHGLVSLTQLERFLAPTSPYLARLGAGEADTSTHNVAVARFESPYCSADLRTYLT